MADNDVWKIAQSIENEAEQAVTVTERHRVREKFNWNLYGGIEEGQFESEDKSNASQSGKKLITINFIKQKVNAAVGAQIRNLFDADFVPVEGEDSPLTQVLKQMYISDKEMMDWDTSYANFVLSSTIYQGIEEMYIDYRYHPLGNIAFRSKLPGTVIFDPNWKTDSAKDCQVAYEFSFLTASQAIEAFPKLKTNFQIATDLMLKNENGEQYSDADMSLTPNHDDVVAHSGRNKTYKFITKYEMVTEEVIVETDKVTGKDLPAGGDIAAKLAFLEKENPEWEIDNIIERRESRRVCMVTVVCPQIDHGIIEKKPCAIQVGRIPFFPGSIGKVNGVCMGLPDILKDIQQQINYHESLITNLIENESHGNRITDPMLFGDDEAKMRDFDNNLNGYGKNFWTAPGAMAQNLLPQPIRKAQLPTDIRDQQLRLIDYIDRISGVPAVFDARSERSGESGYLFAQKTRAAEQQNALVSNLFKQHLNEKAEAYLEQARIQYTIAGLPRVFRLNKGRKCVEINKKDLESGKVVNDFSTLPRHKVVISESPASTTNRMIARAVANETLRVIPPELIGMRTMLASILTTSVDNFSSTDKDRLKEFEELEMEQARLMLQNRILTLELQNKQIEAQMNAPQAAPVQVGGAAIPSENPMGTDGMPVAPEKSLGYSDAGQV